MCLLPENSGVQTQKHNSITWELEKSILASPQTNQNQNLCRGNLALILKEKNKNNNSATDSDTVRLVNHCLRNSEDTSRFRSAFRWAALRVMDFPFVSRVG